jgi:glycosyltransferase involved in cell wall biosynthesis
MSHAAGERTPVVSVVIPAYNASAYIAETLD